MNAENNEYIYMLSTQKNHDKEGFIYSIYESVTLKLLCKTAINPNL